MSQHRRVVLEGVPFVIVDLEDLHPANQAEHKAAAQVAANHNQGARRRRQYRALDAISTLGEDR